MTKLEVIDRARKLWGDKPYSLSRCGDDGWFVDEPVPNPAYRGRDARVDGAVIPQLLIRVHILDVNGHTRCHEECSRKEAAL